MWRRRASTQAGEPRRRVAEHGRRLPLAQPTAAGSRATARIPIPPPVVTAIHDVAGYNPETLKRALDELAADANLDILFYTQFAEPIVDGRRVIGAIVANKGGRQPSWPGGSSTPAAMATSSLAPALRSNWAMASATPPPTTRRRVPPGSRR